MRIATFIGLRFLRSPRRDRAVSAITWISGLGITFGVMALVVTISVMNGFRANLFIAINGATPSLRVLPAEGAALDEGQARALAQQVLHLPGVVAVAPYFSRQAFLRVQGQYRPVELRGIDPAEEPRVTELLRFIRHDDGMGPLPGAGVPSAAALAAARGVLAELADSAPGERPGIILGAPIARALGVELGDPVRVISTATRLTPLGPVPLLKTFRLAGVFETGLGGTDDLLAFVNVNMAQALFRAAGPMGLEVRTSNAQDEDGSALARALSGYQVLPWSAENKNVFQVMRLEKLGLFLILALILVVSFFNIISSLVMLVQEKRRAIGVLKALGGSHRLIQRIFFAQGLWIGLLGTAGGLSLGLGLCWVLATFNVVRLPQGVFPLASHLPVLVQVSDVLTITACSLLICFSVTLYPARKAALVNAVETLRNE
ncbi:MAG TPA: ABC transporter permease [bacterium]|nr:ABC transporter permease [bacterium]